MGSQVLWRKQQSPSSSDSLGSCCKSPSGCCWPHRTPLQPTLRCLIDSNHVYHFFAFSPRKQMQEFDFDDSLALGMWGELALAGRWNIWYLSPHVFLFLFVFFVLTCITCFPVCLRLSPRAHSGRETTAKENCWLYFVKLIGVSYCFEYKWIHN